MVNTLNKKLKPWGNTAYFLMNTDDVIQYNLNVGDFYKFVIKDVGMIRLMLKLYGTSKVFQFRKEVFEQFPKLVINEYYDISFVGLKTSNKKLLDKNPSQYKELSGEVDKLKVRVSELETKSD